MFRFDQEIASQLRKLRENTKLTQTEVALRMGNKGKSKHSFIARLEKGMIKDPHMSTILNYLDAVGVSWITFFTELTKLRSKQNHSEIMQGVILTHHDVMGKNLMKKLDRDTLLYETKIKPPVNYFTKIDMDLVKQKIKYKTKTLCLSLGIKDNLVKHYLDFAYEICAESDKEKPDFTSIINKYHISGISKSYLIKIMGIAIKTLNAEKKKVAKQKPIRLEKARSMAEKYLRSRIAIAPVEAKVAELLAEHKLTGHVLYNSYMNFARECFSKTRKFHIKDPLLLKQHLNDLTKGWLEAGLNSEIMGKIKEIVQNAFVYKNGKT
jgi:transcriptional regulator with XRE-family HTH domain